MEAMREKNKEGRQGDCGLSAFDVKSLRQKNSRAECCCTCTGSLWCHKSQEMEKMKVER